MKAVKTKTANVLGFIGKGATVSDAKRDAERQIRETSAGNWIPVLYRFRRTQWLLWRDLSGWNYRSITDVTGALYGCSYATQVEAERALGRHAAQTDCIIGEDDGAWIADAKDRAQHLAWYAWQVRYKQAKDAGRTDDEARTLADNPPHLLNLPADYN